MPKIRVLIVDDAVVVRRLLTDVLASDPQIEVVGVAHNGRIALAKIPQLNPDLVTLDVEMPEMNGLETMLEIRKRYPRLPVIMFSTLTERGAAATLDALAAGANDYVTKPVNMGNTSETRQRICADLLPKIKTLCRQRAGLGALPQLAQPLSDRSNAFMAPVQQPVQRPLQQPLQRIDMVAIGVSTGGPNALTQLIPQFPANFPVPVLIVQHMPPVFTRSLAQRLAAQSKIPVREAAPGEIVRSGSVWIAPGGYHMILQRQIAAVQIQTNQGPPENSCRPAVDVLFRSLVKIYGGRTLAIILTGMGQDGLRGCQLIREAGGQVLAQDEATSVVWGMPGSVAKAGLADAILPLEDLGAEIIRRVQFGRLPI